MKDYIPPNIDAILCVIVLSAVVAMLAIVLHYGDRIDGIEAKQSPTVPPCCYVPGKGIQVCAEVGSLMLPEETGHFRGVRK